MSITSYFLIKDLANLAYNNMWKYNVQEILVKLALSFLGIIFAAVFMLSLSMTILSIVKYFKQKRQRRNEEIELGSMQRWNEEHRRQSRRRMFEPNNNLPPPARV